MGRKNQRGYTVLLAYPEEVADVYAETYQAHVFAKNPADAVDAAVKQMVANAGCGEMGDPPGSDVKVQAVYRGWLEDLS